MIIKSYLLLKVGVMFTLTFIILSWSSVSAQTDSTLIITEDSSKIVATEKSAIVSEDTARVGKDPSPQLASLLSAILPGAGQIYNKKYWKVPVFYAGFAGLGYFVVKNHQEYTLYRTSYIAASDTLEQTINATPYDAKDLTTLTARSRRSRDLFIIGTAVFYVVNIVDAAVDAHLYPFTVDKDLSFLPVPVISGSGITAGLSIRYKF